MAPLSRGLELLESAVSYALDGAGMATPQLLSRPTPCPRWDLEMLLEHLSDSIGVLCESIATRGVGVSAAPQDHAGPAPEPVARLQGQAVRLLGACAAAGSADRLVAMGDRELTASMVAVAGALEVTVHGWDISVACGALRPVPPGLAAVLLPVAPLLIPRRPGLGCSLTRSGCSARRAPATSSSPSLADSLTPRPRPGPAVPKPRHLAQARHGDSRVPGWSISVGRPASGEPREQEELEEQP